MTTTPGTEQVLLDLHEANELVFLLDKLEDWLRHASGEARGDLSDFLGEPGNGTLATAGLVDLLGTYHVVLHQRIKQASS